MTRSYVVAKGAAADLEEIARYTAEQWGEEPCRVYIGQLDQAAEAVAKGEGVFKDGVVSRNPRKFRQSEAGRTRSCAIRRHLSGHLYASHGLMTVTLAAS